MTWQLWPASARSQFHAYFASPMRSRRRCGGVSMPPSGTRLCAEYCGQPACLASRTHAIGVIVPTLYNVIFAGISLHSARRASRGGLSRSSSSIAGIRAGRKMPSRYCSANGSKRSSSPAFIIHRLHHQLLMWAHLPVVETFELSPDPIDLNIGMLQDRAGQAATQHSSTDGFSVLPFWRAISTIVPSPLRRLSPGNAGSGPGEP